MKGRLLKQKGLSLQKALEMNKSNEVTKQQLKSLENEENNSVQEPIHDFKSKGRSRHKSSKKTSNQSSRKSHDSKMEPEQTQKRADGRGKTPSKGKCKYCGNQMYRKRRDYPAFGQVCRKCNKSNHFASVYNAKQSKSVNVVLSDNSDSDLSVLQVETVSTLAGKGKQVLTELIFCVEDADRVKYKKSVVCQLDTGASCNVISYRDFSILLQNGTLKVEKSSVKLKMYDGSIMQPIGETVLKVKHNDSYHTLKF